MNIAPEIIESPGFRGATAIVGRLRDNGFEAYVVGGAPRDLLLGARPSDYDIATSAPPEQVTALFDKTIAVGEQFGVMIVRFKKRNYEVATFRSDGQYLDGRRPVRVHYCAAHEDAQRRDFTVNALFFDPVARKIIDFAGGRRDLRERRIRTVGDPAERFSEDYLRLIRAVRFAARLDFRIERKTRAAMRRMAHLIGGVAVERIGDEVVKMLTGPRAGRALELLGDTGLLGHILPEIEAMRGVEQPPNFHPEGDVFVHTAMMLDMAESPSPALALGLLLHDVGKPPTQRFAPDRIRFDGHCDLGAEMAVGVCRRLRMSNAVTERVEFLVGDHLRIKDTPKMRPARMKRFMRHEGFEELLELFRLDTLASHGDLAACDRCRRMWEDLPPEQISPPPLLTGRDLIAMGHEPGPAFKTILTAVETAQLEGEIATPDEARDLVRRQFPAPANGR